VLFFSFLIFLLPASRPVPPACPGTLDGPLRGVTGRYAFGRSSSPYPFSINAPRATRLSTTSRGISLETRVRSCCEKERVGRVNQRDSWRALRASRLLFIFAFFAKTHPLHECRCRMPILYRSCRYRKSRNFAPLTLIERRKQREREREREICKTE